MATSGELELQDLPIDTLIEAPYNPRRISERALAGLTASIKRFGLVEPIIWNKRTKHVVGGHQRLKVLQALGTASTQVVVVDIPVAEEKALNVALNSPAISGEFTDALQELLETVRDELPEAYDDLLLADLATDGEPPVTQCDPDDVPEPPEQGSCYVEKGDLWGLGQHRILCGDSTVVADVERLMDGKRAGLMNTDPPYGVAYKNDERPNGARVAAPRVTNDELTDEALQAFLQLAFGAAVDAALRPDAAWYLWHAHLTQGYFAAAAAAAADVLLHRQIIWVKPVLLFGRGQYHWKHEPCFMGWVKGNQPPDYGLGSGERTQTTVWEIGGVSQADRKELNHSTPKPIGLFTIPIVKHLKKNEICYEPFSGSGPQIIAAEQEGRRCFAMEIEPRFVQVAIERWQKLTGKKAVKLV